MKNRKDFLSTAWIFVTFNYLYCDLMGLMDAKLLTQYLTGTVEGFVIDESFLLYAGMLMQIPIGMILLCKILPTKVNCWANMIAASIKTTVMMATLFIGSVTKYYYFFAIIEIATTLYIIVYAFRWLREKDAPVIVEKEKNVQVV